MSRTLMLKWYRLGENVPYGSKLIRSEQRKLSKEQVAEADAKKLPKEATATEEQFLYEIVCK